MILIFFLSCTESESIIVLLLMFLYNKALKFTNTPNAVQEKVKEVLHEVHMWQYKNNVQRARVLCREDVLTSSGLSVALKRTKTLQCGSNFGVLPLKAALFVCV